LTDTADYIIWLEEKLESLLDVITEAPPNHLRDKPSCYGKKLGCEACYHGCPVSDECYNDHAQATVTA